MRIPLSTAMLAAMLAGCNADRPAAAPDTDVETTAAPTAATPTPPAQGDGVTMRYTCADGNKVDIVGGDTARVTLSDGRDAELDRVDGSSPPLYSGGDLQFAVGSEGGLLASGEAQWDCTAE